MLRFARTAALAALASLGIATTARADIHFQNVSSGTVRITLECPNSYEKLFIFAPGERLILNCPYANRGYLRVRTGDTHITEGWVYDGQSVVLFRNRYGAVDARTI